MLDILLAGFLIASFLACWLAGFQAVNYSHKAVFFGPCATYNIHLLLGNSYKQGGGGTLGLRLFLVIGVTWGISYKTLLIRKVEIPE